MDRLNQLRNEAGGSGDSTLDTSSPPSEAYLTANESSKYFSLLEDETNFAISKDAENPEPETAVAEDNRIISNLSPIPKKSDLDSYKIGEQIEAANILSGGVDIFDDNDNSYDGNELVIDDNIAEVDEKLTPEPKANEQNVVPYVQEDDTLTPTIAHVEPATQSGNGKPEIILKIGGKRVDAINIGNGLYLYRRQGEEELAAVQFLDNANSNINSTTNTDNSTITTQAQSNCKFLKVRENADGNLEVYEEIAVEVPKDGPSSEDQSSENVAVVTTNETSTVLNDSSNVADNRTQQNDASSSETDIDLNKETNSETKTEVNLNGKMMKFSESRKSPVIGSYTPMTFHSTPNKEGIPLTKTMVNQQLDPNRHSDNVKKTIEVHMDNLEQRIVETSVNTNVHICDVMKTAEPGAIEKEIDQKIEKKSEELDVPETNLSMVSPEHVKMKDLCDEIKPIEDGMKMSVEISQPENMSINEDDLNKEPLTINETINESMIQNQEVDIKTNVTEKQEVSESNKVSENSIYSVEHSSTDPVDSKSDFTNSPVLVCKSENIPVGMELKTKEKEKVIDSKDGSIANVSEKNKIYERKELIEEIKSHNITDTKISENVVHSDFEGAGTVNCMKNSNCESDLDQKDIKSPTEVKSVDSLNISETGDVLNNVSSTNKEDIDVTANNVITKTFEKDNSKIDTFKTVQTESLKKVENSSSAKKPNADNSSDLTTDSQSLSVTKDTLPISSKIVINSDGNVIKFEEQEVKEKNVTCQISDKNASNIKIETKKEISKINKRSDTKPVINNNAAVPFGKWTEANRQEFLNKIKETKVPTNNTNTKQIKQPNDLNRRDVLQKIDSQRQQQSNNAMAKVHEQQKLNNKNESTAFVKATVKHDTKIPIKERPTIKPKITCPKKNTTDEPTQNHPSDPSSALPNSNIPKKESTQRREINNQALIDKTIEEIINRPPCAKNSNEEPKQKVQNTEGIEKQKGMTLFGPSYHAKTEQPVTLDDIEMKMNELHGIPFVERPAHELPQKFVVDNKTHSLNKGDNKSKAPNLMSFAKKTHQITTEEVLNIDSDDEIIEHEPITGDVNIKRKTPEVTEKTLEREPNKVQKTDHGEVGKKDVIITEKDFDKFFRRNSVTYENCLTVSFDGKDPHNVIQTIVEKDVAPKKLTRNEVLLAESKAKSTHKQQMLQARHNNHPTKIPTTLKYQSSEDDSYIKNYQSKLQIAYQSALTAKRQKESPITIIEDKPVKVVFMDSNVDFIPCQLNLHGEKLSPTKKPTPDLETLTHSTSDSLDSDILDTFDTKSQDDCKIKSRHQRKQVLTLVETPEMELIEPSDLGIQISPKKKRKVEEKRESPKNHVPKKSYLLGRTGIDDNTKMQDVDKISFKETTNHNNSFGGQLNSISAIDNLVKAAELLENQAESNSSSIKSQDSDSQQNTPAKRGRGRPRKYPLADGDAVKNKAPSPQKKPRLIDAKVTKREESDEDGTSDDEIIKENWTMGKINENIVCPICSKLFRSENVVFKHVKHCTGPSPNRSESDKRSFRESQESETRSQTSMSDDMDIEELEPKTPKKRKSKESVSKVTADSDEVIVIEDTPLKVKPEKYHESRKSTVKTKIVPKPNNNLVCEICGKTFRQASYLAHHKLSHKNEDLKRESEASVVKSVFSCEVCKKEFRKLHHLVQHRLIHSSNSAPTRTLRKSSSEQGDNKAAKDLGGSKPTEDQSAGFRCEPCDKSFRKLHHLVEHRETHDARQKATEVESVKPTTTHQCDMCDKTFKKLQLLNEHKDQHLETCSEKSDDKSVKSSLSTKDIIHECSLCYMVFPNEHSLNKHTVICLRKKKQSAAKAKQAAENKESEEAEKEIVDSENAKPEVCNHNDTDDSLIIVEDHANPEIIDAKEIKLENDKPVLLESVEYNNKNKTEATTKELKDDKPLEPVNLESVKGSDESKDKEAVKTSTAMNANKVSNPPSHIPTKVKHAADVVASKPGNTPAVKKKAPAREKVGATVTKRQKTVNAPLPVIDDVKPAIESSDEDEIRYMLNPDFKQDETTESRNFMKVKAKKRNSLQIERPSSRDLMKRRISLQHPPKISRLKAKSAEKKTNAPSASVPKAAAAKVEDPAPSTDSDDSDIKYSFPVAIGDPVDAASEAEKKPHKRKSLAAKRKSLSGVAKRKSLGKAINSKHKVNTPPAKQVKKRTTEAQHRCDCGQLFSSAALLSRHTTLDHTPPRIRRRRSPAPAAKPARGERARPSLGSKPAQGPEPKGGVATRQASSDAKAVGAKGRRSAPQKPPPVPEKLRKLADKSRP